jgi:hypothetical protein
VIRRGEPARLERRAHAVDDSNLNGRGHEGVTPFQALARERVLPGVLIEEFAMLSCALSESEQRSNAYRVQGSGKRELRAKKVILFVRSFH